MSEFNVLGFLAFLNGEVSIDDRWFGDAGPIVGGQKRPFWWRQHLPKVRTELYRRQEEIDRLRAELEAARDERDLARRREWAADTHRKAVCETLSKQNDELTEARRQIDEARRQEPVAWRWRFDFDNPDLNRYSDSSPCDFQSVVNVTPLYAAPVPAQPADDRAFDVFTICHAYESGVGHANDSIPNPYPDGSDHAIAYDEGKKFGAEKKAAQPAVPGDVAKDAARYRFQQDNKFQYWSDGLWVLRDNEGAKLCDGHETSYESAIDTAMRRYAILSATDAGVKK